MGKGRQLWSGDSMRAFFRAHIRGAAALDEATVEQIAQALSKAVNRMLVWEAPETRERKTADESPKEALSQLANLVSSDAPKPEPAPFNPYQFSAIVVLAKSGSDGLLQRLREIKSAENLRAFAEAQHVSVGTKSKRPEDIRKAIVAAAEQRLADRKAAAS
jgi:cobalamin biosynthesis Mg chelatase CobN